MAAVRWVMLRSRRKKLAKFGDTALLVQLMLGVSKARRAVKFWLLLSALAMIVVMLARPQSGAKISNEKRKGIEAVIALDISNSMRA